jgi:hypothetical protein
MIWIHFLFVYFIHGMVLPQQWVSCGSSGSYCSINQMKLVNFNGTNISQSWNVQTKFCSGYSCSYRYFNYINAFYCHETNFGNPCLPFENCNSFQCYYRYITDDEYYNTVDKHPTKIITYFENDYIRNTDDQVYQLTFNFGIESAASSILYVIGNIQCKPNLIYTGIQIYQNKHIVQRSNKNCAYEPLIDHTKEYSPFIPCAEENNYCSFPNSFNIYSVAFGHFEIYNGIKGAAVIREFSGSGIICKEGVFPSFSATNIDLPDGYSKICAYSIHRQFSNIIGTWKLVSSCFNCKLSKTLTFGVSSSNSDATSETWSESFAKSANSGMHLKVWSSQVSLSDQQSHAVTTSSSSAFTTSKTESCTATCSYDQGPVYLFQFVITAGELCTDPKVSVYGTNYCPTQIDTCHYLCKQTQIEPKCIPSECVDNECLRCN